MADSTPQNAPDSDDEEQYYANRLLLITLGWLALVLGAGVLMIFFI